MSVAAEWRIYGSVFEALRSGDIDGALRQIGELRAETRPIGAVISGLEAECHRRRGDRGKALAILEQALATQSECYWNHYDIATLYREEGRTEDCVTALRKAHRLAGWEESEKNGYTFLHDYFSPAIPAWSKWFDTLISAAPIDTLEIGSWQGGSATWLLDKVVSKRGGRLTCVDTFEGSSEHASWIDGMRYRIGDLFDANILASGHAESCRKLIGTSQSILRTLNLERFDFIYIDGAHEARYVIEDAVLSFGLLREGGFICFDDYDFKFPADPGQNTSRAIDAFLDLYQHEISFVEKGRQVLLRKGQSAVHQDRAGHPPQAIPNSEQPAAAIIPPPGVDTATAKIAAEVTAFIASREPDVVLRGLFQSEDETDGQRLRALAGMLPPDQIALIQMVEKIGLPHLESAVMLLAALRQMRGADAWVHFNICKYLDALIGTGVEAAKLPAVVHAFLALSGLGDDAPAATRLPRDVLARELPSFAHALDRV